jgi:hypothetical protein
MSGKEITPEKNKPKVSKMAILSVLLGVLGFFIVVLRITTYRPWWSEFVGRNIVGLSGIVGLILGMLALARISRLIAVITSLVILCPLLLFYFSMLMRLGLLLPACGFFASLAYLVGLLIGVAVFKRRSMLREKFRGSWFATLSIFLTALLLWAWWAETCGPMSSAAAMACGNNLIQLQRAMFNYANENQGQYPNPNQWCDLLLKYTMWM